MKNILFLPLILAFLTVSCISQRKCLERYPPRSDTLRIISVRDSIIFRDTTLTFPFPLEIAGDTIWIPCPKPEPPYIPDTARAETSLALAKAWFRFPNIELSLIQKDTTIERKLTDALKEIYRLKTEQINVTEKPAEVKYIPGLYRIALFAWVGFIIALIAYLILKIRL